MNVLSCRTQGNYQDVLHGPQNSHFHVHVCVWVSAWNLAQSASGGQTEAYTRTQRWMNDGQRLHGRLFKAFS